MVVSSTNGCPMEHPNGQICIAPFFWPPFMMRLFQGVPIEEKYEGDGQLLIDLSQVGIKAREVKWLSVWCTVFERSFGHVIF